MILFPGRHALANCSRKRLDAGSRSSAEGSTFAERLIRCSTARMVAEEIEQGEEPAPKKRALSSAAYRAHR